jgi:hypothetical protein
MGNRHGCGQPIRPIGPINPIPFGFRPSSRLGEASGAAWVGLRAIRISDFQPLRGAGPPLGVYTRYTRYKARNHWRFCAFGPATCL